MTNTNINISKNFNKDKPIIKNMQNINTINPKAISEVMNEIKLKQVTSLSSYVYTNYDPIIKHETTLSLVDTIQCTHGIKGGFCKCCGNFTEYSLRRRRFY